MKDTTLKLIILIGILCGTTIYFVSPALGNTFRYSTLIDSDGITISEESNRTIQMAYNFSFSLEKGQKAIIEFSVHYVNSTVVLLILGQGQYESYLGENKTSANIAGGEYYFITSPNSYLDPGYTVTYGGAGASISTLTNDDYVYIEFMGDGASNNIWSEPGNYQVVVFGRNPSAYSDDIDVSFNLKVQKTGAGKIIETVFSTMGLVIIVGTGVMALIFLMKSQRGGNPK